MSGSRPSAVAVMCWAGGFTAGVEQHFRTLAHISDDGFGSKTFAANWPHIPMILEPFERWPLRFGPQHRAPQMTYAAPPCSAWSPAGRSMFQGRESWKTDPNADCTHRYVDWGLRVGPKVWVDESVPPILKSGLVEDVARVWMDRGYAFTVVRFDAKFAGLPQQRRRVFLVAHKVSIPWRQPQYWGDVHYLSTAGEAIELAPSPVNEETHVHPIPDHWAEAIEVYDLHEAAHEEMGTKRVSVREAWESLYKHKVEPRGPHGNIYPGRPPFMLGRIRPERPSHTVIGVQVYLHPYETRMLTGREAAKLCGYPDDYVWANEWNVGITLAEVAKAVTPTAAEWLAGNVARGIRNNTRTKPTFRSLTCWAKSPRVSDDRLVWEHHDYGETIPVLVPRRESKDNAILDGFDRAEDYVEYVETNQEHVQEFV